MIDIRDVRSLFTSILNDNSFLEPFFRNQNFSNMTTGLNLPPTACHSQVTLRVSKKKNTQVAPQLGRVGCLFAQFGESFVLKNSLQSQSTRKSNIYGILMYMVFICGMEEKD